MTQKSKCCGAEAGIHFNLDNSLSYICYICNRPCDIAAEKEKEIESKYFNFASEMNKSFFELEAKLRNARQEAIEEVIESIPRKTMYASLKLKLRMDYCVEYNRHQKAKSNLEKLIK